MTYELYYTSAPQGLKRGTSGFCTVAASPDIPRALADRLEALSAYRHHFSAGDSAGPNPTAWAHWLLAVGNQTFHVLSCVGDAGLDHTQRSNFFAHHLVLDPEQVAAAPAGPAWLIAQPSVMQTRWNGRVGALTRTAPLPAGDLAPAVCTRWQALLGDAGRAGVLADMTLNTLARRLCILYAPGQDVFPLLAEALALLPPQQRWDVTFNSYFTSMPSSASCRWRCCLKGTPAADETLRGSASLVLDLTQPAALPALPDSDYVRLARTGVLTPALRATRAAPAPPIVQAAAPVPPSLVEPAPFFTPPPPVETLMPRQALLEPQPGPLAVPVAMPVVPPSTVQPSVAMPSTPAAASTPPRLTPAVSPPAPAAQHPAPAVPSPETAVIAQTASRQRRKLVPILAACAVAAAIAVASSLLTILLFRQPAPSSLVVGMKGAAPPPATDSHPAILTTNPALAFRPHFPTAVATASAPTSSPLVAASKGALPAVAEAVKPPASNEPAKKPIEVARAPIEPGALVLGPVKPADPSNPAAELPKPVDPPKPAAILPKPPPAVKPVIDPIKPPPLDPAPRAVDVNALIAQLQAECDRLAANDPDAQNVREAARLLARTDRSSHLWDYRNAITLLRQDRSKTAVPLLLLYCLKHAGYTWNVRDYAATLTLLTGEDFALPDSSRGSATQAAIAQGVAAIFEDWWLPQRDKISLKLADMSPDRLRRVVAELQTLSYADVGSHSSKRADPVANELVYVIQHVGGMYSSDSSRRSWTRRDLSPALLPYLLEKAGHHAPGEPARDEPEMIPLELVPILASLRQDGAAPDLDKLAVDLSEPNSSRIVCALAVRAAGEKLPADALIKIIEKETRLPIRLPAILALQLAGQTERNAAAETALTLLKDPNAEVQTAAAWVLLELAPPKAVAPLSALCDSLTPPQAIHVALMALGKIKTRESADALARFLTKALDDQDKAKYLDRALYAFADATGCPLKPPPGAHNPADAEAANKQLAREALTWWRSH